MRLAPILPAVALMSFGASLAFAQAPKVPIYHEGKGSHPYVNLRKPALELMEAGALLNGEQVASQLSARRTCKLTSLPKPSTTPLSSRELYARARAAHLRVGWLYQEKRAKPKEGKPAKYWTFNLSGGFVLTEDGIAVTCHHVAAPPENDPKNSYLVAADDDDHFYAVTEILADNPDTDTCIFRMKADHLTALPIATDTTPGDHVVCFSDPMNQRGFYSEGVVARFLTRPLSTAPKGKQDFATQPVWVEVTNDYAMGSSGSAVLDASGNLIGHVSEIESMLDDPGEGSSKSRNNAPGTVIIFHDLIAASSITALISGDSEPKENSQPSDNKTPTASK